MGYVVFHMEKARGSDWGYSWVPVVGPIIGAIVGTVIYFLTLAG